MATKKKSSTNKKDNKLSQSEIKEQITGIEQPGRRNKQEEIQAEISGDIDKAISADEVVPANETSRPSRKRRRASS